MHKIYSYNKSRLERVKNLEDFEKKFLILDVVDPSDREIKSISKATNIPLSSLAKAASADFIDPFYRNKTNTHLTIFINELQDSTVIKITLNIILSKKMLVLVRDQPSDFVERFLKTLPKSSCIPDLEECIFLHMFNNLVQHISELLGEIKDRLDAQNQMLFHYKPGRKSPRLNFKFILQEIGKSAEITSQIRESLLSINRALNHLMRDSNGDAVLEESKESVNILLNDAAAINDHAEFLANKINFLLDATMGMINIEQNGIIKIFSVVTVIFMPPTLIASIYGMNFHYMPELEWKYGHFIAMGVMLLSAWAPYKFFKRKRWL